MSSYGFHRLIYLAALSPLFLAACTGALSSSHQTDTPDSTNTIPTDESTPTSTSDAAKTVLARTDTPFSTQTTQATQTETVQPTKDSLPPDLEDKAHVISVQASGSAGDYRFAVEIHSPDLGCEQYADWWEVIDEDGNLLYRRILAHSHVDEQPFTRSGGPVAIEPDTVVIVRAHMNNSGYGGVSLKGSVQEGFLPIELEPDFAADLEDMEPLPTGCAF